MNLKLIVIKITDKSFFWTNMLHKLIAINAINKFLIFTYCGKLIAAGFLFLLSTIYYQQKVKK